MLIIRDEDQQARLLTWADGISVADRNTINANGGAVVFTDNAHLVVKDDDGNLLASVPFVNNPDDLLGFAQALVQRLQANHVAARLKTTCRDDGNRFVTPNDSNDEAHYDGDILPASTR